MQNCVGLYYICSKSATKLHNFLQKFRLRIAELRAWQRARFNHGLVTLEKIFLDIHKSEKATGEQCRRATRAFIRINLFHADFYFIVAGMAVIVFVTRSFSDAGIDYGPWRPVVVTLAALLAGTLPILMWVWLFPFHVMKRVNIWWLTGLNAVLSANIFAFIEPVIPAYFYTQGVLYYQSLIYGILVFYLMALMYLQMRLNKYVCLNGYQNRQNTKDINNLLPADKRGEILALSAQDHYVKIISARGSHLNRISMKEAVEMLPKDIGLQVHRSHWVAYNAMLGLSQTAGRYQIELRNGMRVPVSRNKISEVTAFLNHV